MTASLEPCIVSLSSQTRPCRGGIRSTVKYAGLMKLIRAFSCSAAGLPEISKRCSHPLFGGVALVESPAEPTSGIAPTFSRSGLQSRRNAEDDAGQQRKADAEKQHRKTDADGGFMRERELRKPVHDELHQAVRRRHANDRPGKRQHQRFREQLPQDARTPGADGGPDCQLVLPSGSAGQRQNRNVSASNY